MTDKNLNPINHEHPKRVAIVISNPAGLINTDLIPLSPVQF